MNVELEVGPVRDMPATQVIDAARLVETGKQYSLSVPRFPGMPLFPGHPPFQVRELLDVIDGDERMDIA